MQETIIFPVFLLVTGGTELDDWPGGIKQKYSTLRPMLVESMKLLGFSKAVLESRKYLGDSYGEEDAVGFWSDNGISICCFPTVETIPFLKEIKQNIQFQTDTTAEISDDSMNKSSSILVIVNQQFFLDPLSDTDSQSFLSDINYGYLLETLNMKGPGALPVRGLLSRDYPNPYKVHIIFRDSYRTVLIKASPFRLQGGWIMEIMSY